MSGALSTVIVGLLFGAVGWMVTSYFVKPVERVEEQRRKAHEEVVFHSNLGEESSEGAVMAAVSALRRAAVALIASAESAPRLVHWYIRWQGWNLNEAGRQLLTMSNQFGKNVEPNLKIVARDNLARALRLPPLYSRETTIAARSALGIQEPK
jgi:hypothetical protein